MHPSEKLLLIVGLGRNVYGRWKFQRMLSAALTAAVLAVIAAVLLAGLALGALYAAYLYGVARGIEPFYALMATGTAGLFLIFILLLAIRQALSHLRFPAGTRLNDAVDAFFDGLFSE